MLLSEMYYFNNITSYNELETEVIDCIDYYNNHRYQKWLNCMTPMEFREYLQHKVHRNISNQYDIVGDIQNFLLY